MSEATRDRKTSGAFGLVATAGLLVMLAGVVFGTLHGNIAEEFPALMDMPWGIVTVIDLYVGLALVAAWITWRERSVRLGAAWSIALVFGGNIVTCIYVLLALRDSGGDAGMFWSGPARQPRTGSGGEQDILAVRTSAQMRSGG